MNPQDSSEQLKIKKECGNNSVGILLESEWGVQSLNIMTGNIYIGVIHWITLLDCPSTCFERRGVIYKLERPLGTARGCCRIVLHSVAGRIGRRLHVDILISQRRRNISGHGR
jgi:hypothetical protein